MNYESGSRFGSTNNNNNNYFGNTYPQTNLSTNSNQDFPPSDPIPRNNMEMPIQNNQQTMENTQPRVDPQVVPLSSHLAAFGQIASNSGNPELLISYMNPTERAQLKADNQKKYNMAPNSKLYEFYPRNLETLMVKYPNDFPSQLTTEMKQRLSSYRDDSRRYGNMFFGGVGYWLLFRTKPWFQLTGNPIQRITFLFLSVSYMMQANFSETEYLAQQIFANNKYFEQAVWKHNESPQAGGRASLLTS